METFKLKYPNLYGPTSKNGLKQKEILNILQREDATEAVMSLVGILPRWLERLEQLFPGTLLLTIEDQQEGQDHASFAAFQKNQIDLEWRANV